MQKNRLYNILLAVALLISFSSCKKTKTDYVPPVEDGVNYEVSTAVFPNPERGFIHTYIAYSGGEGLNETSLAALRAQNVSMILRFFYLDAFKDKAIDDAELALIQSDLNKIRNAGLKAILRFAYTDDMNKADAPLAIVQQHLDQLKPVFENNKDIIAFVQAGFIGAWGEWHSSSNGLATTENEKTVLEKLLSVLPADIMVQVRTPGAKQSIFNTTTPVSADIAYSAQSKARVGHHNDCFLTGGTDYGTYSDVTAEKQYISNEALYVPTGGETCPPSPGYDPTCSEGRNEMKRLKWTYLNLDWYPATINGWKSSGCFDEFHTYLGYRLALVSSKITSSAAAGANISVVINMTNKGYAPLYNKKNAYLVLKNKSTGAYYEKALTADLRECKPLATQGINETVALSGVPAGTYALYLRIADKAEGLKSRIEYAVRLANTDVWVEENNGMNDLKQTLTVTN